MRFIDSFYLLRATYSNGSREREGSGQQPPANASPLSSHVNVNVPPPAILQNHFRYQHIIPIPGNRPHHRRCTTTGARDRSHLSGDSIKQATSCKGGHLSATSQRPIATLNLLPHFGFRSRTKCLRKPVWRVCRRPLPNQRMPHSQAQCQAT